MIKGSSCADSLASIFKSGHILTAQHAAVMAFTVNSRAASQLDYTLGLSDLIKILANPMKHACPCHSGLAYASCCQPLHLGEPAPTAERLMRSRYSAYALKLPDYVLMSWHESTRPNEFSQADLQGMKWLGLEIVATQAIDERQATVTFKARFKTGQSKTQTLHENSRFVLENGQWFYVDGDILNN